MTEAKRIIPGVIWMVLCGLTAVSVLVIEQGWLSVYSSLLVILIAAVKSRMVILHYMEAKHASAQWRFLYEIWNFVVAITLIVGYYVGVTSNA